jgi:DNA-binding response OmpR family regulator
MINSILLVDDENLFHLIFEDACNLLNITLSLKSLNSAEKAEDYFKDIVAQLKKRPDCVFVDLNIIGSAFDGVELIRKINFEYGDNVVIGIISSSDDQYEQAKSMKAGAQFWMVKTDNIEPRLEQFKKDFPKYVNRTQNFTVYK